MAFKMKGFSAGQGTGMNSSSPLNKRKKVSPKKGESYRSWLQRSNPGAIIDYMGPRKVWDGNSWVKDKRSTSEVAVDAAKDVVKTGSDLLNKFIK